MSSKLTLTLLLLGLIACRQAPPPAPAEQIDPAARAGAPRMLSAPLLGETAPTRLGAVTKPARTIDSGHALVAGTGHLVTLYLGHNGAGPRTVTVKGSQAAPMSVPPNQWTRIQVQAVEPELRLEFADGPLLLSQPHLFDPASDRAPNLLLISVDTLRADHFTAERMPRTHALFARGRILERAYSTTPWTLPAHTSLFTGLYPATHGVRTADLKLADSFLTLAEHLRGIGYYTAAFTEGNYVSASYGLDQGFLHFEENAPSILSTKAAEVSKLAGTLEALRRHDRDLTQLPRFYFLHTYEVHCPYVAHGDLRDPEGLGGTQWLLDHDGKPLTAAQLTKLRALYAGEVAYTDRLLAELIESLLAQGNWLIVLTADHGEEFGEHGGLLHAHTVYDETTAVPLAFVGVGVGAQPVVAAPYSLVDVANSTLGLLGLPAPQAFLGRDLFAAGAERRAVFAESFFFGIHKQVKDPMVAGVWREDHKLIHYRNFGKSEISLFDLSQDAAELKNLQQSDVRNRNALFGVLKSYLEAVPGQTVPTGDLSQEQIEAMRSLGYLK